MPNLSELFMYNGEWRLEFIVWPLFLGICVAAFLTVFIRSKLGVVVRAIIAKGAISPDTALTLKELGVENKFFVRAALRGRSALRRVVDAVGCEAGAGDNEPIGNMPLAYDAHPDLDKCRFYIADANRDRAESLYDDTNSTLISAIITVLVALVVACLSMWLVPDLIRMAENMVEGFKEK